MTHVTISDDGEDTGPVEVYFVVSWFGPLCQDLRRREPAQKVPGIVRGVHGRRFATKQATFWDAKLAKDSGGLAIFCQAFEASRARRLFDLKV